MSDWMLETGKHEPKQIIFLCDDFKAIKKAAPMADNNIAVVRAFEQAILGGLSVIKNTMVTR